MQGLKEIQRQNAEVAKLRKAPVTSASPQFIKDFMEANLKAAENKSKSYKDQFA